MTSRIESEFGFEISLKAPEGTHDQERAKAFVASQRRVFPEAPDRARHHRVSGRCLPDVLSPIGKYLDALSCGESGASGRASNVYQSGTAPAGYVRSFRPGNAQPAAASDY